MFDDDLCHYSDADLENLPLQKSPVYDDFIWTFHGSQLYFILSKDRLANLLAVSS